MRNLMKISLFAALSLLMSFWMGMADAAQSARAPGARNLGLPILTFDGRTTITSSRIVAAVFTHPSARKVVPPATRYGSELFYPQPIAMLLDDGTLVWSDKAVEGGAPLHRANIDKKQLGRLLAAMNEKHYFDNPRLNRINFGPDASWTTLFVRGATGSLVMESWHELYENKGKTVATAHGLTALNGQRLEDVLAAQPQDYRDYRAAWTDVKTMLLALIPKGQTPPDPAIKVTGVGWIKIKAAQEMPKK